MSQIFLLTAVLARGKAEVGGGRVAVGLGMEGAGNFLSKGSFDLFGGDMGGERPAAGLGDERNITFVGIQCLSKVKPDLAFLS